MMAPNANITGDDLVITSITAKDMRWPTSLGGHGSDAMHTDPDYSCVYVTINTERGVCGNGLTFTLGRGTDIVAMTVKALSYLVQGRNAGEIFLGFGQFWRELTSESQLRWIGPEKGVTHLVRISQKYSRTPFYQRGFYATDKRIRPACREYIGKIKKWVLPKNYNPPFITPYYEIFQLTPPDFAVAAIINALWDLWAKLEGKPVWKLLTDMDPELLVSTIDFRYITDVVTPAEAVELLRQNAAGKEQREKELLEVGYPCYTTQVGWIGYTDEYIREKCKEYIAKGFTAFKIKVGRDINSDIKRCKILREEIGWDNKLMVDANQIWDVNEAIEWMVKLAEFKPLWIEEPTSPDDVLGHATISKALSPYGISVATGEMCANRVMFKQFLQADALQFCQIDSARIGGVNEILSVYFMAKKLNVKVVPHAGGVGLCEMVHHLQMWDYTSLSGSKEDRYVEYVDQQHEQFINPVVVENAHYMALTAPGYSTELKPEAIEQFEYPNGSEWQRMFNEGIFKRKE